MDIILDGMGPEGGPDIVIEGIKSIADKLNGNFNIYITGIEKHIKDSIDRILINSNLNINIINAENNITMSDTPSEALINKTDSSIAKGLELLKGKEKSAFISMGNTGAIMAFSLRKLGRIKGILRPALGTVFPAGYHPFLLDMGATSDVKPEILYQFALMGSEYAKISLKKENPKVGLLSIGEEKSKGNQVTLAAYELIANDNSINFFGNIEGDDLFSDKVDVIVCDGFTGNIILKFGEGMVKFLKDSFKNIANNSFSAKLGLLMANKSMKSFFKKMSYDEYGGVPLIGVNGITIIGHGKSNAKAVSNAILNAINMINSDFVEHLKCRVEKRSYTYG